MNDEVIKAQIRLYTEIHNSSGRISGNKETAALPSEGFAYIFRQLRPDEENDDGTRTRLYQVLDLSETAVTILPKLIGLYGNHYFFAYSRIELSQPRIRRIRLQLHDYILHKKQNSSDDFYMDPDREERTCRLSYIPIASDMVDRRLFNGSERLLPLTAEGSVNADFSPSADCNVTLYLFDYYGILEALSQRNQEVLAEYDRRLKEEVDLGKYYKGRDQELKDAFSEMRDKPSIGALYEMTKTMETLAEAIGKKDNFRTRRKKVGDMRYDYEFFLEEYRGLEMDGALQDCRELALEVFSLLTDAQRAIHHCLYDYLYGSEAEKEEAMDCLGSCLEKSPALLPPEKGERFRSLFLTLVDEAESCYDTEEVDEFIERAGEGNILQGALVKSLVTFGTTQSQQILDTILQHAPYFAEERPAIYSIMKYRTFQEFLQSGESPILFIDGEGMRHWYQSLHPSLPYNHREAYRLWKQNNDGTISQMTVEYSQTFETMDDAALTIIQGPVLETHPDKIRPILKKGVSYSLKALEGLSFIFDGLNVLEQVDVLINLQKNDEANGALISLAGSSLSILNRPVMALTKQVRVRALLKIAERRGRSYAVKTISKVATQQAGKIVGGVGILLYAREVSIQMMNAHKNKDENARNLYAGSFAFAAAALVLSFVPGANVAVWVCLGISAILGIMGSVVADDPVDLFLKYSFWGKEFHSIPATIPNWWINGREGEEAPEGFYVSDETYQEKIIDFDSLNERTLNAHRLLDMDRNLEIMNKAVQIPRNEVAQDYEGGLNYAATPYLKLRVSGADFGFLESLRVRIFQSPRGRRRRRFLGIPLLPSRVDPEGMAEIFNKSYGRGQWESGALELLFIPHYRRFRRAHMEELSQGDRATEEFYKGLSREEFRAHFTIAGVFEEVPRIRFDCNKVFEVTYFFSDVVSLSPVIYRIGENGT